VRGDLLARRSHDDSSGFEFATGSQRADVMAPDGTYVVGIMSAAERELLPFVFLPDVAQRDLHTSAALPR
jgi:hypothetical protein